MTRKPYKKSEKGQSFVELGISFVAIMLLFSGIIDFGRAFYSIIVMREAVQEGVIYGSIFPDDLAGIESRARSTSITSMDLTNSSQYEVSVAIYGNACTGGVIEITITHDLQILMPFMGAIVDSDVYHLKTTINETIIRPPC